MARISQPTGFFKCFCTKSVCYSEYNVRPYLPSRVIEVVPVVCVLFKGESAKPWTLKIYLADLKTKSL